MEQVERVIINGIPHDVLAAEQGGLLIVRRPNGTKEYVARRLEDSPIYGSGRAYKIAACPRRRAP